MIETLTSASVLTLVVFAAAGASRVAMDCTGQVVSIEAAGGRASASLDRVRTLLLSASAETLTGIPASSYGTIAELMLDEVDYRDLNFRTVSGYTDGTRTFVPALDQPPYRLYVVAATQERGSLVLDNGRTSTILLDDVRSLRVRRAGKEVHVVIESAQPESTHGSAIHDLGVVLMVP